MKITHMTTAIEGGQEESSEGNVSLKVRGPCLRVTVEKVKESLKAMSWRNQKPTQLLV